MCAVSDQQAVVMSSLVFREPPEDMAFRTDDGTTPTLRRFVFLLTL